MTTRQQRDKTFVDDALLAEYHTAYGSPRFGHTGVEEFGLADYVMVRGAHVHPTCGFAIR
ncbi:MAG: hypothetical protein ACM31L_14530 [Actinomycetota bacterium]